MVLLTPSWVDSVSTVTNGKWTRPFSTLLGVLQRSSSLTPNAGRPCLRICGPKTPGDHEPYEVNLTSCACKETARKSGSSPHPATHHSVTTGSCIVSHVILDGSEKPLKKTDVASGTITGTETPCQVKTSFCRIFHHSCFPSFPTLPFFPILKDRKIRTG